MQPFAVASRVSVNVPGAVTVTFTDCPVLEPAITAPVLPGLMVQE